MINSQESTCDYYPYYMKEVERDWCSSVVLAFFDDSIGTIVVALVESS
jgi:hypothetical protein